MTDLPIDGDEDHAEQRGGHIAVEEEWKEATEGVAQDPRLVDIARRRQRQIEGAEEQVGAGQADDKRRRRVRPQFPATDQCRHRQRIACQIIEIKKFV